MWKIVAESYFPVIANDKADAKTNRKKEAGVIVEDEEEEENNGVVYEGTGGGLTREIYEYVIPLPPPPPPLPQAAFVGERGEKKADAEGLVDVVAMTISRMANRFRVQNASLLDFILPPYSSHSNPFVVLKKTNEKTNQDMFLCFAVVARGTRLIVIRLRVLEKPIVNYNEARYLSALPAVALLVSPWVAAVAGVAFIVNKSQTFYKPRYRDHQVVAHITTFLASSSTATN